MIAARLSRDDCLLRGRYEPPAARRGSQVRPCRLLAALRSVSCVWPLLRSRQHCLSAGAYRCPLPVGGVLLAGGGRAPRQCPRALATLAPRHGGFLITFAAAWFAPYRRGADLRGVLRAGAPAPRLCGSGGPRPFSPSPLPTVAPRRGRRGFASLRESGARYARGFFFGYRVGGGGGGWVRLTRPRVRAPRPLGVRYATRQRPLGAAAPPPPPPSRTRRSI